MNRATISEEEAVDRLVTDNIPLVHYFVKLLYPKFSNLLEYDDVVGYAFVGAVKAAQSYNSELGYRFSTLLGRCINNEVSNGARNYHKLRDDGNGGTVVRNYFQNGNSLVSSLMCDDRSEKKPRQYSDESSVFEERVALSLTLRKALSALTPLQRSIIYHYYFLNYSSGQVAAVHRTSKQNESQIRQRALFKLREIIDEEKEALLAT